MKDVVDRYDAACLNVVRWGRPGSPLLPQTLRRALADEVLPEWLLEDLGLPSDSTALALDSSAWHYVDRLPARAERFLLGLVANRVADIRDLGVIEGRWPAELAPERAGWPARVRNGLRRAHLLSPTTLESVTFGELLAIPAMGVKSVLEFAAIAESVTAAPARILDETMRQQLSEASEEEWADRVRADDPRFRDVVPPYQGSLAELFEDALNSPESALAHQLADGLAHIRTRAQEIASEPLDRALVRCLDSLGVSNRNVAIVVARLGWGGDKQRTLREVGEAFSLTRERVRQIVNGVLGRLGHPYLPQVERALQLVTDRAPITADAAAWLLVEENLSTVPIDPASLRSAAELLGYEPEFHVDRTDGIDLVLAQGLTGTGPVYSVARRQAGKVGVSNVSEVHADLVASGHKFSPEAVSQILRSSTRVEFLEDEWFWMPSIPPERNRLHNVTKAMLSVTPRLDAIAIRQGVRRRYRFRHIDVVPSISVLKAFYRASPDFVLNEDGTVEFAHPLDYRNVLGDVEQTFVEVLRTSSTGLMDRAAFEESVTEHGVNANTFSVFTTYSPILDHPALNVWCLRGHPVDSAELEALRAAVSTRTRRRRILAHGWEEDGRLRVAVEIANVNSPVIGIPAGIARYLAGRQFQAKTQEGTPAGNISVDESGTSWGYGPYLRRRGAEPGDVLTLRFDLVSEEVTLVFGDDDALIDEHG